MNRIPAASYPLSLLGLVLISLLLASCDQFSTGSASGSTPPSHDSALSADQTTTGGDSLSLLDSAQTRGLNPSLTRMGDFSFKDYFPTLYPLVESDAQSLREISAYAQQILYREGLNEEQDLIRLFQAREEIILPPLQSKIENLDDQKFYDQNENLEAELNQLGLTALTAEAMFVGLGIHPILEIEVARIASQPYQLYLDFQYADASSQGGEYPYTDLKPFQRMLLAGEALQARQEQVYFAKIKERYEEAFQVCTDIHLVADPRAREMAPAPMVGGVHTDHYPFLTETESMQAFAKEHPESAYGKVAARLLENMSEMSSESENLYLIVTEWLKEEDQAVARVQDHLRQGRDIPHSLKIRRGDGSDQYAVTYRFYEDSEKADAALKHLLPDFPESEMIFVSVKGDQLYQLGPAN